MAPRALLPISIVVGAAIIAAALVFQAATGRYILAQGSDGLVVRLDRLTGQMEVCIIQEDTSRRYVAPCDGARQR